MEQSNEFNLEEMAIKGKKEKKEYEAGCLSVFRKMDEEQYQIFIKQLSDNVSYKLDILRNVVNDDILFLKILDFFAGENVIFPSRKQLFQTLDRTSMYVYVKEHDFSEEAFVSVSKRYGEKLAVVKSRILRVSELLDKAEYASLIKAQEKLKAKRKAKREENKKLNNAE